MKGLPELYIARHGETEWNRLGRWQGGLDSPLTEKGRAQAAVLGEILQANGVTPKSHRFYTSPQGRARRSAEIALAPLGGVPRQDDRLREIDVGDWTGLTFAEMDARNPPPPHETPLERYARVPGGETFDALWSRVGDFLADMTEPSIIFSHGITSRFLRTRALGLQMDALDLLEGGQGCWFHIKNGTHSRLDP